MATPAALAIVGYPSRRGIAIKGRWLTGRHRFRRLTGPSHSVERGRDQSDRWLAFEERFANLSVQQVFWRASDEGHDVASMRTWYRVAARQQLSGVRVPKPAIRRGLSLSWRRPAESSVVVGHYPDPDPDTEDAAASVCDRGCVFPEGVGWRVEHREHDVCRGSDRERCVQ